MRISKDSAGERFVFALLNILRFVGVAAFFRGRVVLASSVHGVAHAMFLAISFAHLVANHINLSHNDFMLFFAALALFPTSSGRLQIIDAISLSIKLFAVHFNGADAFVDLEEPVCPLKVDVELRGLPGEKNSEFCSLFQWRKIQALNDFIKKFVYG